MEEKLNKIRELLSYISNADILIRTNNDMIFSGLKDNTIQWYIHVSRGIKIGEVDSIYSKYGNDIHLMLDEAINAIERYMDLKRININKSIDTIDWIDGSEDCEDDYDDDDADCFVD